MSRPMLLALVYALVALATVHGFTLRTWDQAYALANTTGRDPYDDREGQPALGRRTVSPRAASATHRPSRASGSQRLCFQDGPCGRINAAATFSRRLMQARGVAMGEEFRAKGVHVFLGPAMDLMRNPKAGRAWESFGPDPYLTGEGAFATIVGVQSVGVQACAKHLVANNQEHWRYGLSALIDDRTMHEMYWYPFLRSIELSLTRVVDWGHAGECDLDYVLVQPAERDVGVPQRGPARAHGARYVVSDWGATHDSTATNANAGLDMEQPGDFIIIGGGVFGTGGGNLASAVSSGDVAAAGYPPVNFDAQHSDGSGALNLGVSVRSAAHTALVREIGAATTAPPPAAGATSTRAADRLPARVKAMAVVGKDALLPNLGCNDLNECNDGTMVIGWGSGSNSLDFVVPPITAIQAFVGSGATIATSLSNDVAAGAAAAKGKDVALVFVNAMSGELGFYDIVVGNMGDRNDLDLWTKGWQPPWARSASRGARTRISRGLSTQGAPGEQTGPAIVDVLYGAVNPSGRLPFSIDEDGSMGTLSHISHKVNYTEQLLIDYRYMDAQGITPHYEFGFGLSYTTFAYSALSITATGTGAASKAVVTFTVANTGAVAGTEIPQLYLTYPASAGEPKRVLRGFEEVVLAVGASAKVTMNVSAREMSIWNVVAQAWMRPAGTFTVTIGASIKDFSNLMTRFGSIKLTPFYEGQLNGMSRMAIHCVEAPRRHRQGGSTPDRRTLCSGSFTLGLRHVDTIFPHWATFGYVRLPVSTSVTAGRHMVDAPATGRFLDWVGG
ncbi:hypothetical protein DFH09DRAFT_1285490 [Mycena vulgaris]|nr:hypothetical protein DFH09DRAFT_1285490 [Mycena vulgaris]